MHPLNKFILQYEAGVSEENIENVLSRWEEPHRFYHNTNHLNEILDLIYGALNLGEITETEKHILVCVAIYHDAIYIPGSNTNEEESAALFLQHCKPDFEYRQIVADIILDTKTHSQSSHPLSEKFINYDLYYLRTGNLGRLIEDGKKIMKEFQKAPYNVFKQGRIHFLNEFIDSGLVKNNVANVRAYLDWLESYKPSFAIYAGSFNPFHVGHYDILKKAENIFDKVILAVGINAEKASQMQETDYAEIINNFPVQVQNREIAFFDCFLTEFASMKAAEGVEITLVKGIRNANDLSYENELLRYMEDQDPNIKIVYIPADRNYTHVSSRFIKELEKREPGSGQRYLL